MASQRAINDLDRPLGIEISRRVTGPARVAELYVRRVNTSATQCPGVKGRTVVQIGENRLWSEALNGSVSTDEFMKKLIEIKARGAPFIIEFRSRGWLADQIYPSGLDVPPAVAQCVADLLPAAVHDGLVARFLGCEPPRLFAPATAARA